MGESDCCSFMLHTESMNRNASSPISLVGSDSSGNDLVDYCAEFVMLELRRIKGAAAPV